MTKDQEQIYNRYLNAGFSQEQLEEIKLGIEDDLDVMIYARPNITAEDMSFIHKYLNYKRLIKSDEEEKKQDDYEILDLEKVDEEYKKLRETQKIITNERIIAFAVSMAALIIAAVIIEIIILLANHVVI